jgi:hypothetical protein
MAITIESSTFYVVDGGNNTSFTTSASVTPAGSQKAIIVGVVFNNNQREVSGADITACTFNSSTPLSLTAVTGTKTANDGVGSTAYDDGVAEFFEAVNPDSSAHTVSITVESAVPTGGDVMIGVWALSGVDQTTPVDNGNANKSEAGSTNPAVTITSASGDLTLAACFQEGHTGGFTHAAGPTTNELSILDGAEYASWTGDTSRAFSWTSSTNDKWVASGLNVNQHVASYTYDQIKFRWRNDDGSESAATWQAVEGTNPSTVSVDTNTRLRIEFTNDDATNSGDANETFKWQYKHTQGTNTWTDITTTSSVVKIVDSSNLTDGGDTTQQLGSGTFESNNNAVQDASNTFQITGTLAPSDVVEAEISFQIVRGDVDDADTIDFRIVESAGSVEFDGYTKTPRATVQKPAKYDQTDFQVFKKDLSD